MENLFCVLENLPVTDQVPDEFEITILRSNREHSGGLPKADLEPQAAPPGRYLLHLPIIAVHFVIAIINKRTGEVWNCIMRPIRTRNEKFLDIVSQYVKQTPVTPTYTPVAPLP